MGGTVNICRFFKQKYTHIQNKDEKANLSMILKAEKKTIKSEI